MRRICALPFAAMFAMDASGANISWNGAVDGVWSTGGDWVGGVAPLAGDVAVFDAGSVANLTTTMGVDRTVLGLRITTPGGLITIGGANTLTLGAGGIDMSAASQNLLINALLALAADQSWNVGAGRTLTVNGVISGTGVNLNKIGLGDLTLAGVNTFTGTTTIGGGTLNLTGSLNGTAGTNLTFTGTGVFNVNAAAGVSQGMGALNFSGGDGVVKSTHAGSGSATVTFSSRGPRATGATGNFVLDGGIAGTPGTPGTNNIAISGALTGQLMDRGLFFNGSSYAAYDAGGFVRGVIYGTDANAPAAIPTAATLGVNDASQNVQISGDITAQTTAAVNTISDPGSFSITLAGGQTLSFNGLLKSGGNVAAISGGTGIQTTAAGSEMVIRTDAAADTLTISTPILANGTSSLTKSGTGTLVYSVDNTYTGGTAINAGVLQVGTGGTTGSLGAGSVNNSASLVFNRSDAFTVANVISGSGSLTKSGGGTLTLTSANTYTGATVLGAGTLTLSNVSALSGTSGVSMSSGTTIKVNAPSVSLAKLNPANGGGGVVAGSFLRFTGGAANATQNAGPGNGPGIISGTLEMDTGNFTTNWEISLGEGAKITSVQGAILQAISANAGIRLYGNATFESSNSTAQMTLIAGAISAGSAGLKTFTFTGTEDFNNSVNDPSGVRDSGSITDGLGQVAVVKNGSGTMGLRTIDSYSGGTTVNAGLLKVMSNSALGASTGAYVSFGTGSTGKIQLHNSPTLIGLNTDSITIGSPVIEAYQGTQTLTINNPVANTYAGTLKNGLATPSNLIVTKGGPGTLTLTGATRTYTNGTNVNNGTLVWGGAVNLPTSGTLAVGAAGNFSLADGVTRNTTASTVTLASGATLTFDWNGGVVDKLAPTVALTPSAGATVGIAINPTNTPSGSGLALLTGVAGSTLNNPNYFLANNTNYTATLTKPGAGAGSLTIGNFASATPLTSAYWIGGQVTGALGAMALSTGGTTATSSNWAVAAGDTTGTANGLVPGAGTDIFFSTSTGATQQSAVVLGADMSANSLTFNDSTAVTIGGTNYLTLGSGGITVNVSSAATTTISAGVYIGATQTWNIASGKQMTMSGVLAGANSSNLQLASTNGITIAGGGTVLLSGAANTYSGAVTVDNATAGTTLKLGAAGALGAGTGSALNVSSITVSGTGAALDLNGITLNAHTQLFTRNLFLNGTGIASAGALTNSANIASTYTGLVTLGSASSIVGGIGANTSGNIILNNAGTITGLGLALTLDGVGTGNRIDSIIGTGSGSLTKSGAGTWILAGANTYTGTTTINAGTLQIGNAGLTGSLATNGSIINNANLAFNRTNITTQGTDFSSVISGTGSVTQNGSSFLTLNGVNTYLGNTVVNAGTLNLGGTKAISTGTLVINGGRINSVVTNLVNENNNAQIWNGNFGFTGANSLNIGTGAVSLGTAAGASRTVTITANTLTVGGAISNGTTANSITKAGAGTLILGGNSAYTGATLVNAGTLLVNGSLNVASAVTVTNATDNTTAVLGGTGTINGPVSLSATAATNRVNLITAAGIGSYGTLTLGGGLTFNAGSIGYFDIIDFATRDFLNVTGNLTASSGTIIQVSTGLAPNTYPLIGYTGAASPIGNFSLQTLAGAVAPTGYFLTYTANQLNLVVAASPVWNGSGGDDNWTSSSNWATPVSGTEILHFAGSTRTTPNNNFASGTIFSDIVFDFGAAPFTVGGNSISMAGDIINNSSNNQTVNLPLALSRAVGTVVNTGTKNITLGGAISDGASAGKLIKIGSGTLTLTAVNSYTGGNTVNAGTLAVSGGGTLGAVIGPLSSDGVTAIVDLGGTSQTVGVVTLKNGAQINNGTLTGSSYSFSSGSVSAILDGSAPLSKITAGTVTLSAANTFNGATTISAGIVNLANNLALQNSPVEIVSSNALAFAAGVTTPTLPSLAGSGSFALTTAASEPANMKVGSNGSSTSYSGILSGLGGFTKEGGGTLTLNAATPHTYNGPTTINGGTLKLQGLPIGNGIQETIFDGTVSDAQSNIEAFRTAALSLGASSGKGILTTALHYQDDAAFSTRAAALGAVGFNNDNLAALWITDFKPTENGAWGFRFAAVDDNASMWIDTDGNGTFELANRFEARGCCGDSGDTFTPSLTAGQSYKFGIVMNDTGAAGYFQTMQFKAPSSSVWTALNPSSAAQNGLWNTITGAPLSNLLPVTTALSIASGATFDMGGANQQVASLAGPAGALITNSGTNDTVLTVNNSATATFDGVISDGATKKSGLAKNGSGTLVLSGANTFTGPVTLSGGVLSVGADANLGVGNALILDGGTLKITGTVLNSYSSGLIGTHAVSQSVNKTIGFDISDPANNFVVNESLTQGTGGLIKLGAGKLTLAAGNTYTGDTAVTGGTLVVNGSISGTTTLSNGSTLTGDNGTLGNLVVNGACTFSPGGAAVGALTLNGNLDLNFSSNLVVQFNSDLFAVDSIAVNGNLNISAGAVLNVSDIGSDPVPLYDIPASIITYGGAWNGVTFLGIPDDSYFTMNDRNFLISYDGAIPGSPENIVTLTMVAVPEPGAAIMLLGGLGILLGTRRRRM